MERLIYKFLDNYLGNEFNITEGFLYNPYNFDLELIITVSSKKENNLGVLRIRQTPDGFCLSQTICRPMMVIADFFSLFENDAMIMVKNWFLFKLGIRYDTELTYAVIKLYRILNIKLPSLMDKHPSGISKFIGNRYVGRVLTR